MPDLKVSTRTELAVKDLDLAADLMLVTDTSATASRAMPAAELIRPSLPYLLPTYDFATNSLNPSITFTRASSGYRENSSGVLVSEATDVARFDHDPIAYTKRGLLIEEAATNLLTYSEDLANAAWTKVRISATANAIAAPDGTMTADKLTEDGTAATSHYVNQTVSYVSGTTYAFSAYAKADTRSFLYFQFPAGAFTSNLRAWFDVDTGAVGTTPAGVTSYIQNVGGGWYLCTAIAAATATISTTALAAICPADSTITYSGDGVSGLYLWGMSLTGIDCVTSYIQTVAATAARSADIALAANPRVLSDQCWAIKGRTPRRIASGAVNMPFCVDDGTNTNRRCLQYRTDGTLAFIATAGGATQCLISLGAYAADTDFSASVRWADNNFAASLNGGAIVTDLSGINPLGLTTARVGRGPAGNYWNSTIRHIETRRTATDTELPLLSI